MYSVFCCFYRTWREKVANDEKMQVIIMISRFPDTEHKVHHNQAAK